MKINESIKLKTLPDIDILDRGIIDYNEALKLQEDLRGKRSVDLIKDTILLLEHNHVYTVGRAEIRDPNWRSKLVNGELPKGAKLVVVGRGGRVTYHGPGQLMAYFIFKLKAKNDFGILRNQIRFLNSMKDLCLDFIKGYGIDAEEKRPGYNKSKSERGIWYYGSGEEKKIVSQGVEFRTFGRNHSNGNLEAVSMHGVAINLNTDLTYFNSILPCGFKPDVMESVSNILGIQVSTDDAKQRFSYLVERWRDYYGN